MREPADPEKKKQAKKQGFLARLKDYFYEEEFADLQDKLSEENKKILRKFRNSD